MAKSAGQVIDDYLKLAREADPNIGISLAQEAKFLGISAGHLSQLKNSKAKLSNDVIDKVATALSRTGIIAKEELVKELHRSREANIETKTIPSRPVEILFEEVGEFFAKVSNIESLVCVDYRDFPQTDKDGPYPELAQEAADAIASGCAFAMFQPFGSVEEQQKKLIEAIEKGLPLEGRTYLLQLAKRVRKVYREIKASAEKRAKEEGKEDKECQIVLYEADDVLPLAGCGISSRMLYGTYMEEESPRRYERTYQWVAGIGDKDYFIERNKTSVSLEAIAQQFEPVHSYWMRKKKLPRNNQDLKKAFKEYGIDDSLKWKIPPEEILKVDDK